MYDNSRCYVRFIYNVRLIRRRSVYITVVLVHVALEAARLSCQKKIMEVAFSMHPMCELLTLANLQDKPEF